jgi:hypothetical protein
MGSLTTMEQFQDYVKQNQPEEFLKYQLPSDSKRQEFQNVMRTLQIPLCDKKVLDIGPGYGDAMDVCQERGASQIHFVEYDPVFYQFNVLKGYKGYPYNHLWKLNRLEPDRYDLIWAKGSIIADFFQRFRFVVDLNRWLQSMERLGVPGCQIIVCPYWHVQSDRRVIQDFQNSVVTRIFCERGYQVLDTIERHNTVAFFPISFYKQLDTK